MNPSGYFYKKFITDYKGQWCNEDGAEQGVEDGVWEIPEIVNDQEEAFGSFLRSWEEAMLVADQR